MDWFRVYDSIIDDPKILNLRLSRRWTLISLWCIASKQSALDLSVNGKRTVSERYSNGTRTVRGRLPDCHQIALHLRISQARTRKILDDFIKLGFIDEDLNTKELVIHGWDKRQRMSDDSYLRVKRFRSVSRNVAETLPRVRASDTDTDTEKSPPNKPPFEVPSWIPSEDWSDFEEMRRKIKKPMTDRARRGIVKELLKLQGQGHAAGAVLEQSIRNNWQDVFPIRPGKDASTNGQHPKHVQTEEEYQAELARSAKSRAEWKERERRALEEREARKAADDAARSSRVS